MSKKKVLFRIASVIFIVLSVAVIGLLANQEVPLSDSRIIVAAAIGAAGACFFIWSFQPVEKEFTGWGRDFFWDGKIFQCSFVYDKNGKEINGCLDHLPSRELEQAVKEQRLTNLKLRCRIEAPSIDGMYLNYIFPAQTVIAKKIVFYNGVYNCTFYKDGVLYQGFLEMLPTEDMEKAVKDGQGNNLLLEAYFIDFDRSLGKNLLIATDCVAE